MGALRQAPVLVGTEAARVQAAVLSASVLTLFGSQVTTGRLLLESDERNDAPPVMLVTSEWVASHSLSPTEIVGQAFRISDGDPTRDFQATVVGVLVPGFQTLDGPLPALILPLRGDAESRACVGCLARGHRRLTVVGRLAPGTTLAQARGEMTAIGRRLAADYPESNAQWPDVRIERVRNHILGERTHDSLWILQALVLMIAVVTLLNVATFLLARGLDDQPSAAIRRALGAPRARMVWQRATESGVLMFAGGLIGLSALKVMESALLKLAPTALPRRESIALDGSVVLAVLVSCLVATVLVALLPSWTDGRVNWGALLSRRSSSPRTGHYGLTGLLAGQVALAVVSVFVAGLFLRTAVLLARTDAGFQQEHAVIVESRRVVSSREAASQARLVRETLSRLPHVTAVGGTSALPFGGVLSTQTVDAADSHRPAHQAPMVEVIAVTPGYFEAMGIPVLAGRTFTDGDTDQGATSPVILNDAAARALFGEPSPIGQRVRPNRPVIGVVPNTKTRDLRQEAGPAMYRVYAGGGPVTFVLRTTSDPHPLMQELQQRATGLALGPASSLQEWVNGSIRDERSRALLTTGAGILVLLLALIGTIGITAHAVSRRRREWAVRLALGAEPRDVVRHIVLRTLRTVATGALIGLVLAFIVGNLVSDALFLTSATEPLLVVLTLIVVIVTAALAAYGPARRATRNSPSTLLRFD